MPTYSVKFKDNQYVTVNAYSKQEAATKARAVRKAQGVRRGESGSKIVEGYPYRSKDK